MMDRQMEERMRENEAEMEHLRQQINKPAVVCERCADCQQTVQRLEKENAELWQAVKRHITQLQTIKQVVLENTRS